MDEQTIFLFDVDGVLIRPLGYKEAIRDSLDYFAQQMGQPPIGVTLDEIADFEAVGMSNEWLSGAMCLAALLVEATAGQPTLIRDSLAATLRAIAQADHPVPRPDFSRWAFDLQARGGYVHTPEQVLPLFKARSHPDLHAALDEILATIYPPRAPFATHFQHLVLGDQDFEKLYGRAPQVSSDSYLKTRDRVHLAPATRARLHSALHGGGIHGAIYTARPSLPGQEVLRGLDRQIFAPEADMAAEMVGLDIPIIGAGQMWSLAARHGLPLDTAVKPSPVHALAAILAAITPPVQALEEAYLLFSGNGAAARLGGLLHMPTRVVVFEDTAGGLRAGLQAVDLLRAAGAPVRMIAEGIAGEPSKQAALAAVAHHISPDINTALERYL